VNSAEAWDSLSMPWHVAFEQAWQSFRTGNFGIGAVLVDPATLEIVAVGRNRVGEQSAHPRTLSGNMTAHAEMNAFAALDRFNAEGLHLYTTLEPCLMCAATAMQLKVAHVHFATYDEFYDGMSELWAHHPVTAKRQPSTTGPFGAHLVRLAQFARLLPMIFTLEQFTGRGGAEKLARETHPELAALFDDPAVAAKLAEAKADGSIVDGLAAVWDQLPQRSEPRTANRYNAS
jgi:tRNA(Arg) A34 adenosine deaminase TadA